MNALLRAAKLKFPRRALALPLLLLGTQVLASDEQKGGRPPPTAAVGNLTATSSNADNSAAALCAVKVRGFVESIDGLLSANPNDVYVFREPIRKYMPAKGCDVEEVISISKTSKFFVEAYDWSPAYTIIFQNPRFDITFGLRKDTAVIKYPFQLTG